MFYLITYKMFLWIFNVAIFMQVAVKYIAAKCIITNVEGVKQASCQNQGYVAVPQNLPTDIQRLVLSDNNFTNITDNAFSRYKLLKEIVIDRNNLRIIDIHAFHALPFLRLLSMSDNHLNVYDAYPAGVFEPIANLSVLDIGRNLYETYKETFYSIPINELINLQELTIDLASKPSFGGYFKELHHLNYIKFDFCYTTNLKNETFAKLPVSIKKLNFTACQGIGMVHQISVEANALGYFQNLTILDLTNSNFNFIQALHALYPLQNKTMKALLFRGLKSYDLILSREPMKYLKSICIETLDLSLNNIVSISDDFDKGWFELPDCFKTLIVSGNRFSMNRIFLPFSVFFQKMTNLELFDYSYVSLGYQNIVFLCADVSDEKESIHHCSYNTSKDDHTFLSVLMPSNIKYLRLTHLMARIGIDKVRFLNSSLIHMEMSYMEIASFPWLSFEGHNNLQYLDISGISAILSIDKMPLLEHLKNLTMRDAELYKLVQVSRKSIFHWAPNLKKLDISSNYLWHIQRNFVGDLPYLTQLILSHNMFAVIPEVVTSLKNLNELDLSYNLITTVQENIRTWIDQQQIQFGTFILFLNKNSLTCSCETYEFLLWLASTKSTLDNKGNYSCWISVGKHDTSYTLVVILEYHNYFVECNDKLWIKIGSSLLASSITILLCITILYNCRWRIIFLFYRRFRKIAETGLDLNFKYDVYVSYSDDSATFVKQVMAPKLEREWGLKMCCEDRDFLVGDSNADVRADSIHCSRHIIFLVTPSFMRSEWSKFEIERAKYEKFAKDLQKIVVITKDISINTIPFEFATFWKDICLIEWPNDQEGLPMTWQKLRLWFF